MTSPVASAPTAQPALTPATATPVGAGRLALILQELLTATARLRGDRQPVPDEKVKEELADYIAKLRLYRQNEAFNQWFRKEAEQARVTAPQKETPQQPQAKATKG